MSTAEARAAFATIGIFALTVVVRWGAWIHHDVAWSLYLTREWLNGQQLYVDLVAVNPPLIYWLSAPSVELAQQLSLRIDDGFSAFLIALAGVSIALTVPLCRRPGVMGPSTWPILAFLLLLLPGPNFGQREHLTLLLIVPVLVLQTSRLDGRDIPAAYALTLGVLSGLGLCLKPHFLLAPVLVAAGLWWRRGIRPARLPESWGLAAVVLVYPGVVWLAAPAYFDTAMRYALEVYHEGYGSPVWLTVLRSFPYLVMASTGMLAVRVLDDERGWDVAAVVGLASFGFWLAYVAQARGFDYQSLPCTTLAVWWVAWITPRMLRIEAPIGWRRGVPPLCLGVLIGPVFTTGLKPTYENPLTEIFLREVERVDAQSVVVFSPNLYAGFPLVLEADVRWASRMPCHWLTPGLMRRRVLQGTDSPLLDEIDAYVKRTTAEDLRRFEPELVFVDDRSVKPYFEEVPYDYLDHLGGSSAFRAAWAHYRESARLADFVVYQRVAGPEPARSEDGE